MLKINQIALLFPVFVTLIWFISFLFTRFSFRNPRFILALFMGAGLVTFLSGLGLYGGVLPLYRAVYPWVFFTALSLFPLFYLYVYQLTMPYKVSARLLWHFLPAAVLLMVSLTFYGIMMSGTEQYFYIRNFLLSSAPPGDAHWKFFAMKRADQIAKALYIVLSAVYYLFTFRIVNRHQQVIEDYYSSLKEVSLNWVRVLALFFMLALFSGVWVHWVSRLQMLESGWLLSVPFLFLGLFFALVGNYGNRQQVGIFPDSDVPSRMPKDKIDQPAVAGDVQLDAGEGLPPELAQRLSEKVETYFRENRPYLNSDLKIWDVARALNTNRTYISKLINQVYGSRFSAFVNQYRIEEAKKMMHDPKYQNYSLNGIASVSGFHNYSSFVRAFNQFEGIAPNEFRRQNI